jgi:hypothetical protein
MLTMSVSHKALILFTIVPHAPAIAKSLPALMPSDSRAARHNSDVAFEPGP